MSSLKHSIHRRVHLERATPVNRLRFGILERKKDYKIRAKRYHEKENLLKSLSEKARTRNPDEFDFGMVNSRLENGRYKKIGSGLPNGGLTSAEERKLAESQNLTYVHFRKSIDNKKIERMEKELTLFGQNMQRSHVFFDDEHKQLENNPQENKSNTKKLKDQASFPNSENLSNEIVKNITKSYKILNETIARSKKLDKVSKHLELQRDLKSKGKKKKVVTKNGNTEFVWYPKRKK
ncbi:U3 small nucleolar RNA-associated 11 [Cryptosporidium sp. chipmunk genotype I]|uniref:U3 small nucleolar RNA-associated 11 n=1 Tax=Cryptosporidium sp. chipmunk genotype I TaxID=1280935 RepID=UPI00351A6073|nr:U3 small nucleolar RNA-associated 11 [Cryptosporidium sp. chipmunk genotype I]